MRISYGSSDVCSSDLLALADERLSHRLASCGRPMLLTRVEIMDEAGALLERGERGEIVLKGNLVTPGYYKNAEATDAAKSGGWHRTGDVGYRDSDGYLYIVDRTKDMIITGDRKSTRLNSSH